MKDAILTIVTIAVIFIGIPLVICFFKDWFALKKHRQHAPEGSRFDRIQRIEARLNTRHTTGRGAFWIAVGLGLGAWLIYKNVVWQPDKREWHDLFGVVWVMWMIGHGIALIRFRGIPQEEEMEEANQASDATSEPSPPQG